MSLPCPRCGIGHRDAGAPCDWCAAPVRARLPFWALLRRRLARSRLAAALRRRGAVVTGVTVGVLLHLLAAAVGVVFGLPLLWQAGFLGSLQWWWALVPEAGQPWLFAAARGAAYGALAGYVVSRRWDRGAGGSDALALRSRASASLPQEARRWWNEIAERSNPSTAPMIVTGLTGFLVSMSEVIFGWNPGVGLQYSFIAAALAAAVGRVTTWIMRGQ